MSHDRLRPDVPGTTSREELSRLLSRHFGRPVRLAHLERRPSPYRTSASLEELDVRLDDGTTLPLLLKELSRRALLPVAQQAKPAFLYDPTREIAAYQLLAANPPLGPPAFYGAIVDSEADRYSLLLERVAGHELYQIGSMAVWQHVSRWLATLHHRFGDRAASLAGSTPFVVYDGPFYRVWPRRAVAFARAAEPSRRRQLEWLVGRYERVVERLLSLPVTLIHGELYASNVIVAEPASVAESNTEPRVCPVDWETTGIGPGLVDLAALTAGAWTETQRNEIVSAYLAATVTGDSSHHIDRCVDLDYCRLHLAMQWLGWSANWTPPASHQHDWLAEALRLAERLPI